MHRLFGCEELVIAHFNLRSRFWFFLRAVFGMSKPLAKELLPQIVDFSRDGGRAVAA